MGRFGMHRSAQHWSSWIQVAQGAQPVLPGRPDRSCNIVPWSHKTSGLLTCPVPSASVAMPLAGEGGVPWPQIVALIGSLCWKFHLKSFTSGTRGAQEAGCSGGARARGPQAGLGWIPQRLCRDWPHPGPGGRNLGATKSGWWSAQPRLLARTWLSPPPGVQSGVSSTLGRLRGSQTQRQEQSAS